jgi:hypothetical protein
MSTLAFLADLADGTAAIADSPPSTSDVAPSIGTSSIRTQPT